MNVESAECSITLVIETLCQGGEGNLRVICIHETGLLGSDNIIHAIVLLMNRLLGDTCVILLVQIDWPIKLQCV